MKRNAVLVFCIGELYWEFARFAPYVIWKRCKQYKNRDDVDFIILTRPENFDIYGKYANIFVPFRLKENSSYKQNCFRLDGITEEEYNGIIYLFKKQFEDRYNIIEILYPNITKHQYSNKNQFPRDKYSYLYAPRDSNLDLLKKYVDLNKKNIILAPRFRNGFKRNWPYWNELYDLIWCNNNITEKYNFIICGRNPDYVPDYQSRFLDINKFEKNINTSLIGLTIECLKKSILTIGSQSAIPNISLLLGTEVLSWGHQKHLHTVTYNTMKTKITFIDDFNYSIKPQVVYNEMLKILK